MHGQENIKKKSYEKLYSDMGMPVKKTGEV